MNDTSNIVTELGKRDISQDREEENINIIENCLLRMIPKQFLIHDNQCGIL